MNTKGRAIWTRARGETYPMLYKMDRKPDWKVFLNIVGTGEVRARACGVRERGVSGLW